MLRDPQCEKGESSSDRDGMHSHTVTLRVTATHAAQSLQPFIPSLHTATCIKFSKPLLDTQYPLLLPHVPSFLSDMTVKEQVVHDRVNLVRLMRRLDKSVNEADWGTGRNWTLWLKSERVLQVGLIFSEASIRSST